MQLCSYKSRASVAFVFLFFCGTSALYVLTAQNSSSPFGPKNQKKSKQEKPGLVKKVQDGNENASSNGKDVKKQTKLGVQDAEDDNDKDEEEENHPPLLAKTPEKEEDDEEEDKIEVNVEFATDFIFRGNSFGSETISQRDNIAYKSFLPAYTFQPSIEIPVTDRLTVEFWFNLFMSHLGNRDSDQRFLQNGPGGPELLGYYQPALMQGQLPFDPRYVHPYKEDNGLKWDNGGEIEVTYELSRSKFGNVNVGFFSYNTFLAKDRFSWTQFFVNWEIPAAKFLNPKLSFYKTTDPDNLSATTGINKGWGYIPFEISHEFKLRESMKLSLSTSIGYIIRNNPADNRSGFSDITTTAKYSIGSFFLSANVAYRPDMEIYDNSYYFDNIRGRYQNEDGLTVDPSKQYGIYNNAFKQAVVNNVPDPIVQKAIIDSYQSQAIVRAIYYFSIGYTKYL
ncbi:hypothetical protein LEP1GSC047_2493 [Leptospira inadai serovar Lyme str. 10]|uniref:Uncharacterized protein n=1 Tax=Leptospira inadai serovar Lyme str. 10 TaxID=1049790 RepID=V6HNT0_9LEPT|nr:hypothetical protein [Leptospira inadai]EQA38530.1 hypothetical protein LEP1GSC047_2493 [Leptospira inadai serovar Lyme str. 10]